jgi:hypothetical protein
MHAKHTRPVYKVHLSLRFQKVRFKNSDLKKCDFVKKADKCLAKSQFSI